MSSSSEDGTDREEPPPRQNLQAALQLLRRQPHRGTEGRSGENEEENDSPHHAGSARSQVGVFDVEMQSVDLASQDIDFNLSPPEGVVPPSSSSLASAPTSQPHTNTTTPLRPYPPAEPPRRQNEREGSSVIDIEAMVNRDHELLIQHEQQQRSLAQERARHAEELRRIAPRVPHDPASATDTNSDGEPPSQLRTSGSSSPLVVPSCPHPLVKTIRAPSLKDRNLPQMTSSDSSSSDPYPDPSARQYKPRGEQKVPRAKRVCSSSEEPLSQQSEREQGTDMDSTILVVEDQQQANRSELMPPPTIRSLRTQSSDENSHSSSSLSSDHSAVMAVVTMSTCMTTTNAAEVRNQNDTPRNRDTSGNRNQDNSENGNQDVTDSSTQAEIPTEYIGDVGSMSLLSDSSESVLAMDSLLLCSSRSHVTLSTTSTVSSVSHSPLTRAAGRSQTASVSPLVLSASHDASSRREGGQDLTSGGQKRVRDEPDMTNGSVSSVAGTHPKKQRTQYSSEETIILSTTHSSSSFSSTSDSTDKQQSLSSSSSLPLSGDSFKIPSSPPLKSSQISRSSSTEETANCSGVSKADSGGSSGYSASQSRSSCSPSPPSSNPAPVSSPLLSNSQPLLSSSQPVSNNDVDTLPTLSFSGDNIITSTPEDPEANKDGGEDTNTITSSSCDTTGTSSGGSHGDGSRGGGAGNEGDKSFEERNDELDKKSDDGNNKGGDNFGDNKDGGAQEGASKDSSSQEMEKEADKTVCPVQSSAAVETTTPVKAPEDEQRKEDDLIEGGQSPVLLPSQDTDDRPDELVAPSYTVSPAPSTANSSQVCSSFMLRLSPSQSTQHGNDSTRDEDLMEVETEKQPSLHSGSEAARPKDSLAKPLSDNVQDTVGVTTTLIQTHSLITSHQLQTSSYNASQLSGTPFHFQLPCEGLLQPQLTLPPPSSFSQTESPTNTQHRHRSCPPPELVEKDKDTGIDCLFNNDPVNERQQETVITPVLLFEKETAPTSRKSLSLRRHKSAGDRSSMSVSVQRAGEQEESMQIEPVVVEKVDEHEALVVEVGSEENAEPVTRADEQESESLIVNEQETEALTMEQETEPLAAEGVYDQETEPLIVEEASRKEPVMVDEQETDPLIVREQPASKQGPVIVEEASEPELEGAKDLVATNEQESEPMIIEGTDQQETECVVVVGEGSEQEPVVLSCKQIPEPARVEVPSCGVLTSSGGAFVLGHVSREEENEQMVEEEERYVLPSSTLENFDSEGFSGLDFRLHRVEGTRIDPQTSSNQRGQNLPASIFAHPRPTLATSGMGMRVPRKIARIDGSVELTESDPFRYTSESPPPISVCRSRSVLASEQIDSDSESEQIEPPAVSERINPPMSEQIDRPMSDRPVSEQINPPMSEQIDRPMSDRPVSEQINPPMSEQIDRPMSDRPVSEQIDRPMSDRPVSEQIDRPVSERINPPMSEQIDRPVSEQIDRPVSEQVGSVLTASDTHNDERESERYQASDEQSQTSQDDSLCTVTLDATLSSTLTTPISLARTTSLPPPSQMPSSSIHNLSLPGLLSSPSCADHPSAPYIRVTEVVFRVVKEIENKIVEKSTGRVLDQYTEQVSDRPFKTEYQLEHLNEVPPSPSASYVSDSSIQRPSTPLPGSFASPSSLVSNHTPLPREAPLPYSSPIPTLYQQQHNPLTPTLPLQSSSPHSLSSSPRSSISGSTSTASSRGRRSRLQRRTRLREDTTGQAESPATSLQPPSPSLPIPRVGEKVLASWRRDNKWYVATIDKISETRAHIIYLDGDHGQLQLSSLLPLEILKEGIMVMAMCTESSPEVRGVLVSCDNQQQFTLRDDDGQISSCSLSRLCLSSDTISMLRVVVQGTRSSDSTAKGRKRKRISLSKRNAEQLPHNQATLFKGKVFLLTQSYKEEKGGSPSPDVVDRDEVCRLLCDRGGFVMDDFNENQVLLSNTFCLSDQWCRTIKYLTAVAVGLPCLEYDWVNECIRQGRIVDYKDYLLPVGNSQELGRTVQWSPERQQQSSRYLRGINIFLCGQREFKECWKGLLEIQGASVMARQPSQVNRIDGVKTIIVMESGATTPSASLVNLQVACGMPIVAKEWVVQCLVNHKHILNYDQYNVTI